MVKFLSAKHKIHKTSQAMQAQLAAAQQNLVEREFPTFQALWDRACADLHLKLSGAPDWKEHTARRFAELPYSELINQVMPVVVAAGIPGQAQDVTARSVAKRIHLLRAFAEPDAVISSIEAKIKGIISAFPRTARNIECGKNPGDVLDPYLLAAAQNLLFSGSFEKTIDASVSHKIFMMLEDLIGHLHEDVIGDMRGNVRVPEPRGEQQEGINLLTNPFPGADVVQPPLAAGGKMRFHQVKNKTGSAKGGDGKRLGDQLQNLQTVYDGEIFYDALIGNTLRGHRSRKGVTSAAPSVVVLVGRAAFRELTYSEIGPELLLRVYQEAFMEAARTAGYSYAQVLKSIVKAFKIRAEEAGTGFLEGVLRDVTDGAATEQDSRAEK
jgi:hypothetical protein